MYGLSVTDNLKDTTMVLSSVTILKNDIRSNPLTENYLYT